MPVTHEVTGSKPVHSAIFSVRPKCRDRILDALRLQQKTAGDLCVELFVDRTAIADHLGQLLAEGLVFRRWRPNPVTAAPEYLYSTVRYRSKYCRSKYEVAERLESTLGDWDAVDMRRVGK
jgi:predicted ArsR family transcriptional regulator